MNREDEPSLSPAWAARGHGLPFGKRGLPPPTPNDPRRSLSAAIEIGDDGHGPLRPHRPREWAAAAVRFRISTPVTFWCSGSKP